MRDAFWHVPSGSEALRPLLCGLFPGADACVRAFVTGPMRNGVLPSHPAAVLTTVHRNLHAAHSCCECCQCGARSSCQRSIRMVASAAATATAGKDAEPAAGITDLLTRAMSACAVARQLRRRACLRQPRKGLRLHVGEQYLIKYHQLPGLLLHGTRREACGHGILDCGARRRQRWSRHTRFAASTSPRAAAVRGPP